MEPRPHERGKNDAPEATADASPSLQWSHVLTNVESNSPKHGTAPNKPLQWSHVLTNVERREFKKSSSQRARSFNGATSSRTWKVSQNVTQRMVRNSLQWSHVLTNVESVVVIVKGRLHKFSFNGATSSRTWKEAKYRAVGNGVPVLQWSHVLTNVERISTAVKRPTPGQASMEPRPHERGKDGVAVSRRLLDVGFNGATSSRTWKAQPLEFLSFFQGCFNGATSSRTWKEPRWTITPNAPVASMEPRPHERGKRMTASQ